MASPFRKGKAVLERKPGSGQFLTIGADQAVSIAPLVSLDQMISVEMHEFWDVNPFIAVACFGANCPGCMAGSDGKFKAYLPIVTQEGEAKIFSFGISIARQLEEIESELGDLTGKVIKVKRQGSGLKTRYSVIATGKEAKVAGVELPDILKALGPDTPEAAAAQLVERGLLHEGDWEPTKRKGGKAAKPAVAAPADTDADETDDWGDVD